MAHRGGFRAALFASRTVMLVTAQIARRLQYVHDLTCWKVEDRAVCYEILRRSGGGAHRALRD
jgi:hypothetical protein